MPAENTHRLVVVGGGVAGLDIATHLSGKKSGYRRLSVSLIDRETGYVWKPMLHTIAAGTSDAAMQQTVYAAQALSHRFDFQLGEAVAIDRQARVVQLAPIVAHGEEIVPARAIPYDTLVLAVGSHANDFGTPGVAEHCVRIDMRSEAVAFNDQLRMNLLKHGTAGRPLTVGIVGGGATGVELAAELVRIAAVAERYRIVDATRHMKVVLIESGPRLLAPFPEAVAQAAQDKLRQLGVEIRVGTRVTAVDAQGFELNDGERLSADMKVWAAGVKAPALLDSFGDLDRTKSGQLIVGETLRAGGDPNIFALGDCASPRLPGREAPVPTTAQAAHQQARYLCRYLPGLIDGKAAPPASYHDFGSLVSLGGFDAYGSLGRFGLFKGGFIRGRVAQLGHALLYRSHQVRIHGLWKGSLLWLVDMISRRVRPPERLS